MEKMVIVVTAIFALLLLGCQPLEEQKVLLPESEENAFPENASATTEPSSADSSLPATGQIPSATACAATWLCLDSQQKIYRYENCSFGKREPCKFGCFNDSCRSPEQCTVGFKCKNSYVKGYQLEDCSWTSTTKCDYGCKDAECLPKENRTEESSPAPSSTSSPAPLYPRLAVGETVTISGEGAHNLSIYILEPDQVKMQLDQFKSDWLSEKQNFTFGSAEVQIFIREILFQSFEGGKREVAYEVKE